MVLVSVPAIKSIQNGNEVYLASFDFLSAVQCFIAKKSKLDIKFYPNRHISRENVLNLREYILKNKEEGKSYLLPPLIVSTFENDLRFELLNNGYGMVIFDPTEINFFIIDGRHRLEAIKASLDCDLSLKNESIFVVIYPKSNLPESQELFFHANKHYTKITKSLSRFYNQEDDCNSLVKQIWEGVWFFNEFIDMEKVQWVRGSIWYYSQLYNIHLEFIRKLRDVDLSDDLIVKFIVIFWQVVLMHIHWFANLEKTFKNYEGKMSDFRYDKLAGLRYLKENTVCGSINVLRALALVGARVLVDLRDTNELILRDRLIFIFSGDFASIDWSRKNPDWVKLTLLNENLKVRGKGKFGEALVDYFLGKLDS